MSHLKKLADRLAHKYTPKVKPIIELGTEPDDALEASCSFVPSISRKLRDLYIPSLLITAAEHKLVSLSAPQVGIPQSFFVMHKTPQDNCWRDYQASLEDYNVYLNPEMTEVDGFELQWEECPSLPNITANVLRHTSIKVRYMDQYAQYCEEEFSGFPARIFQHELDHLWGFTLANFSVNEGNLSLKDKSKGKKILETLEEYQKQIQLYKERLEERYLCDKEFKQKVDQSQDRETFYKRQILDAKLEKDFLIDLANAMHESRE